MFRKKGVQRAATPYIMFADSYIPVTVPSVTSFRENNLKN